MEEKQKRAVLLAVAFLLPLVFILVVFVTTYIPSRTLSTEFNFVYATCTEGQSPYNYYCSNYLQNLYSVENGRLIENTVPDDLDSDNDGVLDRNENYRTRLFLHDTELNLSEEISFTEARRLTLNERMTSPDGVAVEWQYASGGNFFPFVRYSNQYGYYLTRGSARKKLELINEAQRPYYLNDFMLLGWVMPQ